LANADRGERDAGTGEQRPRRRLNLVTAVQEWPTPERRKRRTREEVEPPGADRLGGSGERRPEDWWLVEPDVGRVAHGVPARVDRLRSLGNALVPQIAEWIGRRIIDYEEGRLADAA
jgi:site-specific DNA-cytosine methylase